MVVLAVPTVQALCCMVIATAPGMFCVPPTPSPVPPAGVSGTVTFAYWHGAKTRQIFAVPARPIWPPPGAPERPVKLPLVFDIPVKITELMVTLDVTGSELVTGPRSPALIAMLRKLAPDAVPFTVSTPPPGAFRPGRVDSWNVSVPE
jgi:hypothetical protein